MTLTVLPAYIWLIVGKNSSGSLLSENEEGLTGLFIFSTNEKAARFLNDYKLENDYQVISEPLTVFERDLPNHFKAGATHLWMDSESGKDAKISILSMMMELDARPGEEMRS